MIFLSATNLFQKHIALNTFIYYLAKTGQIFDFLLKIKIIYYLHNGSRSRV